MQTAECPPDFPGCKAKKAVGEDCDKDAQCTTNSCVGGKCAEKKSGGEECQSDDECSSGSCAGGQCTEAKKGEGEDCESDDACDSGSCKGGKCSGGKREPKLWIGLQVGLDVYLLPGASDVCKLNSTGRAPLTSGNPYGCLDSSGNAFPGGPTYNGVDSGLINNNIQTGHSDQVQGGFGHGPLTISLSVDYALNPNMLVGVRAGYELLTIPSGPAFPAPIRAEARFTYLIGHDAIHQKLAPMVFVGGGVGEFDANVPVNVFLCPASAMPPGQCTSPQQLSMSAWLTAGPVFGAVGGGARMSLAKRIAATGALKLQAAFGGTTSFLFGVVPELGIQYGF
jgi:hypothetical protein